jgi:hypothetical protein
MAGQVREIEDKDESVGGYNYGGRMEEDHQCTICLNCCSLSTAHGISARLVASNIP